MDVALLVSHGPEALPSSQTRLIRMVWLALCKPPMLITLLYIPHTGSFQMSRSLSVLVHRTCLLLSDFLMPLAGLKCHWHSNSKLRKGERFSCG